jgi:uncharacterized protein (TIGR00730 family)
MKIQGTITFFGSSSVKPGEPEYDQAMELGGLIAKAGFVVRNGGYGGTMEAGAKGAAESGGASTGILLKGFWGNKGNKWLSERKYASDIYERLKFLIDSSDAFIVLPGSSGTLAEISLLLEMMAKGIITLAPVIFIGDYWKPFLTFFNGLLPNAEKLYRIADDPQDVIRILENAGLLKKTR